MQIYKEFTFEAAHFLPSAPKGHPNSRVHGHSFRVRVTLSGKPDPETGLVMHFEDLASAIKQVRLELDHHYLNDIEGLEAPTLERITQWIWRKLKSQLPNLSEVLIARDTCHEGCIYRGEDE
jgi:6-pyruvoyltetrahydropterin/6-carboxytetrahydropterin synthase